MATFPPQADHVLVDLLSSVVARGRPVGAVPPQCMKYLKTQKWNNQYNPDFHYCLVNENIWETGQGKDGDYILK